MKQQQQPAIDINDSLLFISFHLFHNRFVIIFDETLRTIQKPMSKQEKKMFKSSPKYTLSSQLDVLQID